VAFQEGSPAIKQQNPTHLFSGDWGLRVQYTLAPAVFDFSHALKPYQSRSTKSIRKIPTCCGHRIGTVFPALRGGQLTLARGKYVLVILKKWKMPLCNSKEFDARISV